MGTKIIIDSILELYGNQQATLQTENMSKQGQLFALYVLFC